MRAVGRIVVCVEAEAEVSTAMIRNLSQGKPKTFEPSTLSTSLWFSGLVSRPVPPYACPAALDDHVDQDEQDRRHHRCAARPLVGVFGLLVDRDAESQPQ